MPVPPIERLVRDKEKHKVEVRNYFLDSWIHCKRTNIVAQGICTGLAMLRILVPESGGEQGKSLLYALYIMHACGIVQEQVLRVQSSNYMQAIIEKE